MKLNEVKMPKSDDYTRGDQYALLAGALNAQAKVDALCEKMRYSIVTACKGKFHRSDERLKAIEDVVSTLHSVSDLVADVCMDTHEALCSASKAYNYASQGEGVGHQQETTACLVEEYVNKGLKGYLEICYDADTNVYQVYSE